jgi:hypothetical protein
MVLPFAVSFWTKLTVYVFAVRRRVERVDAGPVVCRCTGPRRARRSTFVSGLPFSSSTPRSWKKFAPAVVSNVAPEMTPVDWSIFGTYWPVVDVEPARIEPRAPARIDANFALPLILPPARATSSANTLFERSSFVVNERSSEPPAASRHANRGDVRRPEGGTR